MNRLEEKYRKEVVPSLMERHNYKTVMLVPKLEKIVVKQQNTQAAVVTKVVEKEVVRNVYEVPKDYKKIVL